MDGDKWLTVEQAAQHLQVTRDTVRRWLRAGKLQGSMIGGTKTGYRIRTSEVLRLLEVGGKDASH